MLVLSLSISHYKKLGPRTPRCLLANMPEDLTQQDEAPIMLQDLQRPISGLHPIDEVPLPQINRRNLGHWYGQPHASGHASQLNGNLNGNLDNRATLNVGAFSMAGKREFLFGIFFLIFCAMTYALLVVVHNPRIEGHPRHTAGKFQVGSIDGNKRRKD